MFPYLAIFCGGGLGSLCRFALSKYNAAHPLFYWGTLSANVLSCIVLGAVMTIITGKAGADTTTALRYFFAIGFCGGFSTFSTFSWETFQLLSTGNTLYALANIGLSVLLCLFALYIGILVGKSF